MNDQTIPAVTDEDRRLARKWAEGIATGLSSPRALAAARVILNTVPTPPRPTLTVGSVWGDIDALTLACETYGRGQIVVADCEGDVSVWSEDEGWWTQGLPSCGYEPYTIIHTGQGADQ